MHQLLQPIYLARVDFLERVGEVERVATKIGHVYTYVDAQELILSYVDPDDPCVLFEARDEDGAKIGEFITNADLSISVRRVSQRSR